VVSLLPPQKGGTKFTEGRSSLKDVGKNVQVFTGKKSRYKKTFPPRMGSYCGPKSGDYGTLEKAQNRGGGEKPRDRILIGNNNDGKPAKRGGTLGKITRGVGRVRERLG